MTGGIKAQLRRALRTPAVLARWTWRLIVLFKTSVPAAVFYSLRLVIFTALLAPAWVVLLRYYCFSRSIHRGIRYGPHRRNDMDIYLPEGVQSADAGGPGCCGRLRACLTCKRGSAAPREPTAPTTPTCPCGTPHGRPVLLVVCGGAWMIGYKLWSLGLARTLTRRGFIVACMDYRNFPQADVGGMVADVDAAVEALGSHPLVLQHGGDPRNHLYLFGQSAGAHIGACLLVQEALREVGALRAAAAAVAAADGAVADAAVNVEGQQVEPALAGGACAEGDRAAAQQLRQRAGRLLVDGCLSEYCCGSGRGPRPLSPSASSAPPDGGSGAAAMPSAPPSGSPLALGAHADSSRLMTSFAAYCNRHDASDHAADDDDSDDDCASCNGSVTDDGPAPEALDAITLAQTLAADASLADAADGEGAAPPPPAPHPPAAHAGSAPRTGNRRIRRYFGVSGPYDIVGSAAYLCSRGIGWRVLSAIFGGQLERFSPTRLLQHAVASASSETTRATPLVDGPAATPPPASDSGVVATPRSARSASVGVGPAPTSVPPSPLARAAPSAAGVELPPLPASARQAAATLTAPPAALHLSAHLPSVDLFHGTADKTVPHAESAKLADALRSAGAPVTCTLLDGQSHTHAILEGPFGGDDRLLDAMCDSVWGDMHGGVDHRDAAPQQEPCGAHALPSCAAPAHVGTARIVPEVLLSLAARVNPF